MNINFIKITTIIINQDYMTPSLVFPLPIGQRWVGPQSRRKNEKGLIADPERPQGPAPAVLDAAVLDVRMCDCHRFRHTHARLPPF